MLKLPRRAEREYLAVYGIIAIYVLALPTGQARVRYSRDLLHSLLAIRRKFAGSHIACAYWVRDKAEARLIVRQVNDDLSFIDATAKIAQRRIENVAAHMGIVITDHATVLQRTRAAVAFVEQRIDEAQAQGELKWFNAAYRSWRLEAQRQRRGMSYAEARARLRRNIFRQLQSNEGQIGPDQLFPPLPGIDFPAFRCSLHARWCGSESATQPAPPRKPASFEAGF